MQFNQWLVSAITIVGLSSNVVAQTEEIESSKEKSQGSVYLGAGLSFYNNTELEYKGSSVDESADFGDFGYNLLAGYEFNTHKVVKLGG
ncbi:hypothetical protein QN061_19885 [Vibrio fluvialis]|nr:hypothetical protein [Vibrio fluvialis]WIE04912.1 hypothetical protein QN061_19885 [Vibrio fluvialis]